MGGTYLEVLGALVEVLVGEVVFHIVGAFEMVLGTNLILVLVNVKGLGEAGALRGPNDSNRPSQ